MSDKDDPDIIAAEMALGLLEGEERTAARRRMLAEPSFAHMVEGWQHRLQPLHDLSPDVVPPGRVWAAIDKAVSREVASPTAVALQFRRWRATAIISSAVAASLAVMLVLRPPADAPSRAVAAAPSLIAQLGPTDAQAVLLASYNVTAAELTIAPATIAVGGRSAELWVLPEGGKPQSLGLIRSSGLTRIVIPVSLRPTVHRGAALAVSVEPVGGSPTGQPTGPVVALGKFIEI